MGRKNGTQKAPTTWNGTSLQASSSVSGQKRRRRQRTTPTLEGTVEEFLEETRLTKKPKTLRSVYDGAALPHSVKPQASTGDIERRDLLKFATFLRDEKNQSPGSVYNKFENVMTFLKAHGIRGLAAKNDWPRFVQQEPEVYEREELDKFFAICNSEEREWFEFFLMTGMREQEVMHGYRLEVNFNHSTVKVTHKPDRGWTLQRALNSCP